MSHAQLIPIRSSASQPTLLDDRTSFVIGSSDDADLRISEPGIAAHHCVLELREDRWLLVASEPAVRVNGHGVAGVTRLFDRDVLAISATLQWEFVSGERRTAERPVPAIMTQTPKPRSSDGFERPRRRIPWRAIQTLTFAVVLIAIAFFLKRFGEQPPQGDATLLSDQQALQFDSLLVVAYDHLERGNALLELGVGDDAAQEFARGINTLALSEFRNHATVKPRILALESSVAAMYRERRLAVPDAYASATSTMAAETIRTAALTREQFEHAFDLVSGAFRLRFGKPIVVVGRDHAEHLTLYGHGGALDLRSMTMTTDQVAFVIAQCRNYGIRVKDFSQDSILRRQVRAAIKAGVPERAGTGLHLHIDRFADRRDRWTIGARDERRPVRYTNRNLSRVTPDSVNSAPSSSSRGSPRSSVSLSTDVPLRLESMM